MIKFESFECSVFCNQKRKKVFNKLYKVLRLMDDVCETFMCPWTCKTYEIEDK